MCKSENQLRKIINFLISGLLSFDSMKIHLSFFSTDTQNSDHRSCSSLTLSDFILLILILFRVEKKTSDRLDSLPNHLTLSPTNMYEKQNCTMDVKNKLYVKTLTKSEFVDSAGLFFVGTATIFV